MASRKQIEANRRNAQKSTGPTSLQGKAASSMNALKTGLYAESEVLPCESAGEYQQLIERFYADHRPVSALACQYLDEIIYCTWNLRRLRRAEAQLYDFVHRECFHPDDDFPLGQPCENNPRVFSQLQWRMDANRRALDRAVKSLREVQAADHEAAARPEPAPLPVPVSAIRTFPSASPANGFVPDTLPEPALPVPPPPQTRPQTPAQPRNDDPTSPTSR